MVKSVYTSDRVFDGVRIKTGEDAKKHVERVKRALEKKLFQNSSTGRTTDSDSVNLGSNPSSGSKTKGA